MHALTAVVLGIVEGVTEFLPISSTGHLILASSLLGVAQDDFQKSFEIIIQLGAIASVVVLYWRSFLKVEILKRLVVAFIPTGIIGLLLYKVVKAYFLGNDALVLWMLFGGGIALIVFELWHARKGAHVTGQAVGLEEMSYPQAAVIGLFQSLAIVPGVSRSAASIVGGLIFGMRRVAIVEFSFLLAVPTMLAASGLDIARNHAAFSLGGVGILGVGFVTSAVVAFFSIKFLLSFVRTHTFVPFGIYRILAALVFWFILFH
ncbi:MAG TPA: undecaprenyl-diphosphate phosphatase [Candidatus Paceibacterota bacterium]|nr:undecaprenyl-diphosphate phosphatase [Candidatus Paceibacterota bacterium]